MTTFFHFINNAAMSIRLLLDVMIANPNEPLLWVMAPGLVLFEGIGLSPSSGWRFLAAFLIGWFFWVRLCRVLYFTFGRFFGIAGPEQYITWRYLWLPWEKPFQGWLVVRRFFRQKIFHKGPNQEWAGFWEIASYPFNVVRGGILAGRLALSQRIGLHMPVGLPDGGKAVAVISYAGGGKTSWVMTWLGSLPKEGAAIAFDMDGAMVNAFGASLERANHDVVKIDCDGINKTFRDGKWNPMHELTVAANRHGRSAVVAFAVTMSNGLIIQDSKTQEVFANTARVIMTALILYVWLVEKDKSLLRVRQLLTRGLPEKIEDDDESAFGRLIFEMSFLGAPHEDGTRFDDGCNGAICNAIANCCGLLSDSGQGHSSSANAPDNFRKVAIYQTLWLDDPNVAKVIGGTSDFCGEELKLSNVVVFIVSTLQDTQTRLAPLVRCLTLLTLYAFQRTFPDMKLKYPMLLILDEFPQLGRMDTVAMAAPGFRKYGVRLVTISQSIGLLRKTYPEVYREFLNQAECVLWMGIAQTDTESLTYLSQDVLGEALRKEKIDGYHWLLRGLVRIFGVKLPPARYQKVPRPLLSPQQCAAFLDRSTGQIIVTREGRAPMRLQQLKYWKELPVWRYAVHKGHGEARCRSYTRLLLSPFLKG